MKVRYLTLVTVILLTLALTAGCAQPIKKPAEEEANRAAADMRTLQEVAADDPYTKGCLSCHKVDNGTDRTLKTTMNKISDHPSVPNNVTFKECLNCHRKKPERLAKLQLGLHRAHIKSKTFHPKLKGTCVSCHNFKGNGDIQVKGQ